MSSTINTDVAITGIIDQFPAADDAAGRLSAFGSPPSSSPRGGEGRGLPGGSGGGSAADHVVVDGTDDGENVQVAGDASGVKVNGLAARVSVLGAEPAKDTLAVDALGGDDVLDASGLTADSIGLTEDGGEGADVLIGGAGNDTLLGPRWRRRPHRRPR